ncbi:MAG: glycogen/starch synthase [Chitinispirillaceae bacterium]|nr:glycogen/starch synthase [Chitinispirillaceae bacterium]
MATQREIFNNLFHTKLAGWTPLSASHHALFNEEELAVLQRSNRTFKAEGRNVVLLSYENRFATLGGLGAVIQQLPLTLSNQGEKVLLLTPLHQKNATVQKAIATGALVSRCSNRIVRICNYSCTASCYEETDASVPTYHIGIEGRFTSGDNPYGYADQDNLLFDALAFCAVVPSMLEFLGVTDRVLIHAHDWETAPIAVFSRFAVLSSVLRQVRTVLTLHNSFDIPFPDRLKVCFFGKVFPGETVLRCMLPFFHGPLTTVSTPFAHELRHDPLQRGFFADHLQELFRRNPPIGIENGMFGDPKFPFTKSETDAAAGKNYGPILGKKESWRTSFLTTLHGMNDKRVIGRLDNASLDDPSVPVFFMSGRYDLMQKGFDTVFHAFAALKPGSAHLFFTPNLHNGDDDLSFFREMAEQCSGSITIWPFKIAVKQYRTFLQGASFLLMPSLYEPFGAASEGFLHGTPVIARATGGLLSQIHPGADFTVPPLYSSLVPASVHDAGNGILYRETFPDQEAEKLWRPLLRASLWERSANPLYQSIVAAAKKALEEACSVVAEKDRYGAMIHNGLQSVREHSWDLAVEKYRRVYDSTIARGA